VVEIVSGVAERPVLDEVIAGLNPTEVKQMLGLLLTLSGEGITLFMIEHVMVVIMSLCQRILVLHHGEKIAEGPPSQIARHPRVVQAYLGEEYLLA
jgi:branched-chain amino acid transport system ATP-binding protein